MIEMPLMALLAALAQPSSVGDAAREAAIKLATTELAKTPGIAREEIELERVATAEWPDTSLGCAEKGKVYSPVVTPGYVVELRAHGQLYSVHVGSGRAVICEAALSLPPRRRSDKSRERIELVTKARQDLAAHLEVEADSIRLRSLAARTWPDAGLGCPEPGKTYPAVETAGYLIELEHDGVGYRYHTDRQRVRRCERPEPADEGDPPPAEGARG